MFCPPLIRFRTMSDLQGGQIDVCADNWPTCFYEDSVYDPENPEKGLFRSKAAFRVRCHQYFDVVLTCPFSKFYTHLFISPSAAASGAVTSNTSKPSKNRAWGLTRITPAIIAYVHVVVCVLDTSSPLIDHTWQMYFTMSTAPRWGANIGDMDLCKMAWNIIELLGGKEMDPWTRETLAWWNSYVDDH